MNPFIATSSSSSNTLWFISILASLLLSSCSTNALNQETLDYRGTSKAPVLDVPPELLKAGGINTSSATSAKQIFSQQQQQELINKEVAVATQAVILEQGNLRYLETNGKIDDVWNKIGEFFRSNGLVIEQQDAKTGVIITQWEENVSRQPKGFIREKLGNILGKLFSSGQMDKYQAIVEPTSGGKVRVYLAHYGITEEFVGNNKDTTQWMYRPSEPLLVMEMLKRIAIHLGVKTPSQEKVSQLPESAHTKVVENGLIIPTSINTSWKKIILALPTQGWEIQKINHESHQIIVREPNPYLSSPITFPNQAQKQFRVDLAEQLGKTYVSFTPLANTRINQTLLASIAEVMNW